MKMVPTKHTTRCPFCRWISGVVAVVFALTACIPVSLAQGPLTIPVPGEMVRITDEYQPALIRGLRIDPDNPLNFDFIVNIGDSDFSRTRFEEEAETLIKYFLAALTLPEDQMWVNLSPYEEGRLISEGLRVTEMGRDLLAQDYVLKQLTASLLYPEDELGERFWQRVHARIAREFGTAKPSLSTFNKVWIVPDKAVVFERGDKAFVVDRHLKVMLEEDYLASTYTRTEIKKSSPANRIQEEGARIAAQVVRDIIIPEIEKEVNDGRNFANLRQMYNSMILATWYKQKLRNSLLGKVYVDRAKTKGIDVNNSRQVTETIYRQYLQAFKKGVYDFIKEDFDPVTHEAVPRRYFSGGLVYEGTVVRTITDKAMLSAREFNNLMQPQHNDRLVRTVFYEILMDGSMGTKVPAIGNDQAMSSEEKSPESESDRFERIRPLMQTADPIPPVKIYAKHDKVQNLVVLDTEHENFGHASVWAVNGDESTVGHSFDLATPTGNRKVTFDVFAPEGSSANGFHFQAVLENIIGLPRLPADKVFAKPEMLRSVDQTVSGSEFVIRLENLEGLNSLLVSTLRFGSGKSIKDEKRSGPADPTAAAYTKEYVDEGRDIQVHQWYKNGAPRFRAMAQPRTADGLHDTHNYLVEMDFHQEGFRPGSVTVALTENKDIVINKDPDVDHVILRVRLYSDHKYLKHMPLQDLYSIDILEQFAQAKLRDQEWFGERTTAAQKEQYKNLVRQLRRQMLSRDPTIQQAKLQDLLRSQIQELSRRIGQPAAYLQDALDPVSRYESIPFLEVERLETLLYNGQFLITHSAAILAGSPHYLTPFGGDVIIILRELLDYLRPEVVQEQFYHLLSLVRRGQLAHEVDIRFSGKNDKHLDKRLESPRLDTELLLLMFATTMLEHPEYKIDWQKVITDSQTAAQVTESVARYVLSRARALNSATDYRQLMGPKGQYPQPEDPRLDWEDAVSSKAYGKYSHLIQYLVPYALTAINKLTEQGILSGGVRAEEALIQNWREARKLFQTTISRTYRIEALMQWYAWRMEQTEDGRRFVLALLEDAKEYYGIDFTFDESRDENLLKSIRAFLESYVPEGDFTYQSKVLDRGGNQIRVADTNSLIFGTSTAQGFPMTEVKEGLELVFTHVAFGGVALAEGSVQTGIPTVLDSDRQVKNPLNYNGAIPSTDLYEIYHKNYHGLIIWLSMNFKRLNGLIRQINHRLNNGEGFSGDVQVMYAAVEVLSQEMNQLAEVITEETLEPFVNGHRRFRWRPYGSDVKKNDADGIQSGFMQGFNMMALPAIGNLRKLRRRIDGLPGKGYMPAISARADKVRQLAQESPEEVRAVVRAWIKGNGTGPGADTSGTKATDGALLNTNSPAGKETVGGIDFNADWMELTIERDELGVPLPVSQQPLEGIQRNIQGFYPVIINVTPINIPLYLGFQETEERDAGEARLSEVPANPGPQMEWPKMDGRIYRPKWYSIMTRPVPRKRAGGIQAAITGGRRPPLPKARKTALNT